MIAIVAGTAELTLAYLEECVAPSAALMVCTAQKAAAASCGCGSGLFNRLPAQWQEAV